MNEEEQKYIPGQRVIEGYDELLKMTCIDRSLRGLDTPAMAPPDLRHKSKSFIKSFIDFFKIK